MRVIRSEKPFHRVGFGTSWIASTASPAAPPSGIGAIGLFVLAGAATLTIFVSDTLVTFASELRIFLLAGYDSARETLRPSARIVSIPALPLAAWNGLQQFPATDRAGRGMQVNRNFQRQPSGQGFDWRMTAPPWGSVRSQASKLDYLLPESTPDACTLLEQWLLDPGRYRLRFEDRPEGLAQEAGLSGTLLHSGRVAASSPDLANIAEWNCQVANAGLVPGNTRREGRAEWASAGLEMR